MVYQELYKGLSLLAFDLSQYRLIMLSIIMVDEELITLIIQFLVRLLLNIDEEIEEENGEEEDGEKEDGDEEDGPDKVVVEKPKSENSEEKCNEDPNDGEEEDDGPHKVVVEKAKNANPEEKKCNEDPSK
uniref:Uncharacterized protein n=1 Tax=Acrobeloides nanus TaxID=290746 RepID=A0A914CFT1_9BILA